MSTKKLQDRVDSYESLLDRLVDASNSERADLLAAYVESRDKDVSVDEPSEQFTDNGRATQANRAIQQSLHADTFRGKDQFETLAVLGCGWFNLDYLFGILC